MERNDRSRSCLTALLIMAGVVIMFLVSAAVIPMSFIDVLLVAAIVWLSCRLARLTVQQASDQNRIAALEELLGPARDMGPELSAEPVLEQEEPPADDGPVEPPAQPGEIPEQPDESKPGSPPGPLRQRPTMNWDLTWRRLAGPFAGAGVSAVRTEARIGTIWFSRIGVLLLIAGGILAYRHGAIPDQVRVLIGYVCGAGLLGLGFWGEHRSYRIWAQAMTGGGLGVLYLTTIAAAMFFDQPLLPQSAAFLIMALITAVGAGLAVLYDAPVIGVLGMLGGFGAAIPLAAGQGEFGLLFGYLAVLDAGLLLVAYFKRWPGYNHVVFVATWALYARWRITTFRPEDAAAAFAFVTVFFLIFAATSITYAIVRRRRTHFSDAALVLINGFVYFGLGLDLIPLDLGVIRGLFAFASAAAHLGLGALVSIRNRQDRLLSLSFLGLAGIFLTLAFPVALSGSWITVSWALEGAVLVLIGFLARSRVARWGGLTVLVLSLIRLGVWDTFPGAFGLPLLAPGLRAFTFWAVILSLYLAFWAYHRFEGRRLTLGLLAGAASVFTLWYLTMEIGLHFSQRTAAGIAAMFLVIAGTWGAYGLLLMCAGLVLDSRHTRSGGRVVLAAALGWLALSVLPPGQPTTAVRYFGLGCAVGSVWLGEFLVRRKGLDRASNGALSLAAAVIAFFAAGIEVLHRLEPVLTPVSGQRVSQAIVRWQESTRGFALASAWGAHAIATMAVGALLRSSSARALAAVMSAFTILAGLVFCVNPAAHPALRVCAFVLVVFGTYLSTFLGGRSPDARTRLESLIRPAPPLAAALLTAWWGAAELHHRFGVTLSDSATMVFSVLLWLGVYGVIIGVAGARLRSQAARWLAFGLQVVVLCGLAVGMGHLTASGPLRAAAFLSGIGGIYAANRAFGSRSLAESRASAWLSLAACAFTVVWLGYEITQVCVPPGLTGVVRQAAVAVRDSWFVLAAGLYGLVVTAAGIRLRSFGARAMGLGIQAFAIGMGTVTALWSGTAPVALRLAAYAAASGGVHTAVWLRGRGDAAVGERRVGRWLALITAALAVFWLTCQVYHYFAPFMAGRESEVLLTRFARDFGVSAAWGVYGFVVLIVGFVMRYRAARLLGLGILVLTLAKVGARDMWQVGTGWRIWITIGIGLLFVISSLMYQRFFRLILTDRPKEEKG